MRPGGTTIHARPPALAQRDTTMTRGCASPPFNQPIDHEMRSPNAVYTFVGRSTVGDQRRAGVAHPPASGFIGSSSVVSTFVRFVARETVERDAGRS